ncbi:MAG: bifunctional ornithine acetyltransferase/N-acetylglutamate synthase [Nitrospirae bacterium GWD2_57_9]|nr:MAG: bifunctional ornithine acetyltransferase/N-acetylglutamate synthase [Nitrospirae bacterium GWD2_57_9]OGW50341.1 MAG: bifunctional ornithine acetyltransferase/N-acetylglutamate synthase [Nitrospirae bacterium GWC2_57_9]
MKILDTKSFSVPGFKVWGIHCGIKKTDKKDLAILYSEREAAVAGVFTKNRVKAASVLLDAARVKSGKGQAIVANSGCANACTGKRGMADARETAEIAAKELGVRPDSVYVASTGVIGEFLPMQKIATGISTASGLLSASGWEQAAEAIMTTDIYPKRAVVQEEIGGKTITVAGIAKGSGMIHPNMATMLCFIVTDAEVSPAMLKKTLLEATERSFNNITVDGDTSTNDMVLCMANGAAGNKRPALGSKDAKKFQACVEAVAVSLARQVVRDGEGATKFVELAVRNAKNPLEAKRAAMAVAKSSLVKTAIFGEDANWGRIMAALGNAGIEMDETRTDIFIGKAKLVEKGLGQGKQAEREAALALKQREVHISIDLHKGKSDATVWTCDMSYEYIKINAAYRN